MKKSLLYTVAMAAAMSACAQKNPTAIKYAQYISVADAKKHLTIIASDAFEGRETGKHGADLAANYLAGEFKKMGLQAPVNGSYFLDVPLTVTAFNFKSLTLNGTPLTYGKEYNVIGGAYAQPVSANEVVFIGYGTDAEIGNNDLAGKVVMFINEDKPAKDGTAAAPQRNGMSSTRIQIIQNLRRKNVALAIGVGSVPQNSQSGRTSERTSLRQTAAVKPLPARAIVLGITADAANILLKNSGKTYEQLKTAATAADQPAQMISATVAADYEYTSKDAKAVDVLGYLPGSDPKLKSEVLVFSAHYDHIGMLPEGTPGDRVNNGADDDGSGTTGILEIARAFTQAQKAGKGPRRSILFLGNVGEEKGLLGSEYYSEHPVFPLANTITDLNIDMIGRVDPAHKDNPNYCYLIGSDKLSTTLHQISEKVNKTYTNLTIDYKYNNPKDPERIYYRSDHYNFAKHGVPIIFYFNGVHEDYHGLGDEVSKIDFPMLVKRAQLVFYTGWELANRNERPIVDVKNDMPADR
jgi:Zn-dependent M28 family amino/carboxypeptidase